MVAVFILSFSKSSIYNIQVTEDLWKQGTRRISRVQVKFVKGFFSLLRSAICVTSEI